MFINQSAAAPSDSLAEVLKRQRRAFAAEGAPSLEQRRADITRLRDAVKLQARAIADAIAEDFGGRARHETLLAEVWPVHAAARHALRHLPRWMKPKRVPVGLEFRPSRARDPGPAARRHRNHRAMELSGQSGAGAADRRARRRQSRHAEALGTDAAHLGTAGENAGRTFSAGQGRGRAGRRGGRRGLRRPALRPSVLHRLDRRGAQGDAGGGAKSDARDPGAWRQIALRHRAGRQIWPRPRCASPPANCSTPARPASRRITFSFRATSWRIS